MKIALAGQLGAGCTEVAEIIVRKTGIKMFNSEAFIRKFVADSAMKFSNFEEYISSGEIRIDRIIEGLVLDTVNLESRVIVEGRSAFFLLKKEGIFKVLLVADDKFRTSRIAERRGIPLEEAEEEIKHSDEERGNLVKRFYGLNWLDPKNYHLVINTSFKKMEDVAETVLAAYKLLFKW